jgi:hypothetical protein
VKLNDFFSFDSNFKNSNIQVFATELDTIPDPLGDKISDHNQLIFGVYNEIHFPVIFEHKYGKNFFDILDTGWCSLFLISDRMKNILEGNQLTGWKIFSIKIYDKKRNEIFGYHGFSVMGRCVQLDYKKSEIIEKRMVPTGPVRKYYKGVGIDGWDGADFFIPEETRHIIITKKAADILTKNKITNMRLENLADMEMSVE